MAKYRHQLPQMKGDIFLTDGGIETTLIFHKGLELPYFATFHLLHTSAGERHLREYFESYVAIAKTLGVGLILESPTWRANPDWAARLRYTHEALIFTQRKAIRLLQEIREEHETPASPMVISGCIGPRSDGYAPEIIMSQAWAERYHRPQVEAFAASKADMICALTMGYAEEAAGIAVAAKTAGMPLAISFTVETDGHLPSGQLLQDAVRQVDEVSDGHPSYYMINCAHPNHFKHVLTGDAPWVKRIRGIRANASRASHAELDEAKTLDMGNPKELGEDFARLKHHLPHLNVLGGCCGTDHRHIAQIADACKPLINI